ncbi:MAG TPA: AAA family ATPase [Candidatus Saccharimonadales bacterium]|nr:AAA family ATPase [Candidatus Saccharimonadales bacterium]
MKTLIAIVGMPGSGKSIATAYLHKKGIPFVRFGDLTDETLKERSLPITPENEQMVREKLRQDFGMDVYAVKAKPKIDEILKTSDTISLDGLYSWEEYLFLKNEFPNLVVIAIYARPQVRYQRLSERSVRPISKEEARARDIAEIENLNKGGPIAIADFLIDNSSDTREELHKKIDDILTHINHD